MSARWLVAVALAGLALLAGAAGTVAQEPVTSIVWASTPPLSGEVTAGNARVTADAAGGRFPLAKLDVHDLGTVGYSIRGRVRYLDVTGPGYLEMWSQFADGARYFSRTLGTDGPMAALEGSSEWRPFELPFFLQGADSPERLEVNVVLPGAGSVEVSPLELVRLDAAASGRAWLSDPAVGAAGAVIGMVIGIFGVAIAWLAAHRRARRYVLPAMTIAAGFGVALVVLSVVALIAGQPPNVVLLPLVTGLVLAAVFGISLPKTKRLYADAELRRMRAMDEA